MVTARLLRCAIGVTIGACVLVGSGCSVVRSVADGLTAEGPPGARRVPDSPLGGPSSSPGPYGAGALDAIDASTGHAAPASEGVSSVYVVSPALTWGALQLHEPHAITGSLVIPPLASGPECSAQGWTPFEPAAEPTRSFAEGVVRNQHVPFGVRSTFAPLVLSLDRDVMADYVMRSGAYLVQRGPVCFESIFLSFSSKLWGRPDGATAYW